MDSRFRRLLQLKGGGHRSLSQLGHGDVDKRNEAVDERAEPIEMLFCARIVNAK